VCSGSENAWGTAGSDLERSRLKDGSRPQQGGERTGRVTVRPWGSDTKKGGKGPGEREVERGLCPGKTEKGGCCSFP